MNHLVHIGQTPQTFICRQCHRRPLFQLHHIPYRIGPHRLLGKINPIPIKLGQITHRLIQRPRPICINSNLPLWPNRLAKRRDHFQLSHKIQPNFHIKNCIPFLHPVPRLSSHFIRCPISQIIKIIHLATTQSPQQIIHRLTTRLPTQIPQRHINACKCKIPRHLAIIPMRWPPKISRHRLALPRITPAKNWINRLHHFLHTLNIRPRTTLAPSNQPFIRHNLHHHCRHPIALNPRTRLPMRIRHTHNRRFNRRNFHQTPSSQ